MDEAPDLVAALRVINRDYHVMEAAKLESRQQNSVFRVTLDSEPYLVLLKLYHGNSGTSRAQAETASLSILHASTGVVPKLVAYGQIPFGSSNLPYTLQEWIRGERSDKRILSGNNAEHQQIGEAIAEVANLFHSTKFPFFGSLSPGKLQKDNWPEYVLTDLETRLRICTDQGLLDVGYATDLLEFVSSCLQGISYPQASLVHGDLVPVNVMLQEKNLSGFLAFVYDFERAIAADPIWEIVQMRRTFFKTPAIAEGFYHFYFDRQRKPDDLEHRLWIYGLVETVQFCSWAIYDPRLDRETRIAVSRVRSTLDKVRHRSKLNETIIH